MSRHDEHEWRASVEREAVNPDRGTAVGDAKPTSFLLIVLALPLLCVAGALMSLWACVLMAPRFIASVAAVGAVIMLLSNFRM